MAETTVQISSPSTTVSVSSSTSTSVTVGEGLPSVSGTATSTSYTPTGQISSTNVQGALDELAVLQFVSATQPSSAAEGSVWYDTSTDYIYVYREVSAGVLAWIPISYGTDDSDTLDGGAY
jgi:hypothetical protein